MAAAVDPPRSPIGVGGRVGLFAIRCVERDGNGSVSIGIDAVFRERPAAGRLASGRGGTKGGSLLAK